MVALLVPVDGSDASLNAVRHAITLARETSPVSVRLLFVYSEPVRLGDVGTAAAPLQMDAIVRRHADPALATAERLLREQGVAYTRDVSTGDVAQSIVEHARHHGCNVILMGTRGAGALSHLVIGSTTAKVIELATVPVTVVK